MIMSSDGDRYKERLKQGGLKNTKHRNSILAAVEDGKQPLTAEEIYLTLKEQGIAISLSSVYRILNSLVQIRLVEKTVLPGEEKAAFELNRNEHKHYALCTGCHKVIDFPDCPLEDYQTKLGDSIGFTVSSHRLEIYGTCKDCGKK
ncbi:MAG: Fur family transcriptional regulator [Acutalibacteraceae bacterium]